MDELLLRRARQGDPEAFESLLTPLEGRIWRICWHYTGERESASDCAQETMLKIWRSLDSYRGDCAFETWVYRIAANCCLDAARKAKRDRSQSIEPLREAGFDPPDPEPGTEEKVIAADRRQRLREGIAQLPEDQREALVMTQLERLSYEDAAAQLEALSVIDSMESDDTTLTITLSEPSNEFLAFLMNAYIIPADYDQQETAPVGTGPYKCRSAGSWQRRSDRKDHTA